MTSESIVIIVDGKSHTFKKGTPNYEGLRAAIFNEDWEAVPSFLETKSCIEKWAKGEFKVDGNRITYKGAELPNALVQRILAMAGKNEDPTPLFKFWERIQQNPSWRSVQQLWPFLEHQGIAITEDGCFLAYKSVTSDLKDHRTKQLDNTPGQIHQMARNLVSDDPETPCHYGFHVGALEYARTFGGSNRKIVICKVDPADVVCIPKDSSQQKMRVCRYEVMGFHVGGYLPSTTFKETEKEFTAGTEKPTKVKTSEPVKDADLESMFAEMDKEDKNALMQRDIASLRRYAALHCKIVGASKLPGGKFILIDRILSLRS